MLRRILSLSILCTSLLFAGVQAEACVNDAPKHDCCPGRPSVPCHESGSSAVDSIVAQTCCVTGISVSSLAATAEPSRELHKKPQRVDPPAILVSIGATAGARIQSSRFESNNARSFHPLLSSLYLSTGRLRL